MKVNIRVTIEADDGDVVAFVDGERSYTPTGIRKSTKCIRCNGCWGGDPQIIKSKDDIRYAIGSIADTALSSLMGKYPRYNKARIGK